MKKILICDDHPIVSSGLDKLFSGMEDYKVVGVVGLCHEIGPAIHRLSPDLLFLDLNMGGENTVEQISGFKTIRESLCIVVFSSYNLPSLIMRAFAEGTDAYLLKSSSKHEILDACDKVVQRLKFIGSEVNLRKSDRLKILGKGNAPLDNFSALHQLTEKEKEIFHLVIEGRTESEIAGMLFLSKHTIHTHRKHLMAKLNLHSTADFIRFSIEIGL